MSTIETATSIALEILKRTTIIGSIADAYEKSVAAAEQTRGAEAAEQLAEVHRQELQARMQQAAARTAQEIAIARRIETADEVEIEEFLEATGEGALGLKAGGKSVTMGASGAGSRVTRRIYRFKGGQVVLQDVNQQLVNTSHITET
ncbi:hypothetical protein BHS06_29825 [Myxococcus xanthus]|uniref:hypothetical protein n=1 Tax=Myxococcus xanthus TaxID=34 RepID=UPI00112C6470|nr:hypothetical protein [Myxococcus xanthus]QDE92842.1 hypothetical protein BHS06_29825 [Myxococcus xanthus]